MAYSDPNATHNPATGTSPPAAWGDAVRDDIVWLAGDSASGGGKPMCRVYNSGNLSIANSTATALTFDSERYDVGAMHSTSANTGRITIPTGGGGIYNIGCTLSWAANATGVRSMWLRVNGATIIAIDEINSLSANTLGRTLSTQYKLAAADYLEVIVQQSSGGALNVSNAANYSPEFYASWVGLG